jgi:hypothetical protein
MMKYIVWILLILLPIASDSMNAEIAISDSHGDFDWLGIHSDSPTNMLQLYTNSVGNAEHACDEEIWIRMLTTLMQDNHFQVAITKNTKNSDHSDDSRRQNLGFNPQICLSMEKNDTVKKSLAFDYTRCFFSKTTHKMWKKEPDNECCYTAIDASLLDRCADNLTVDGSWLYILYQTHVKSVCERMTSTTFLTLKSKEKRRKIEAIITLKEKEKQSATVLRNKSAKQNYAAQKKSPGPERGGARCPD